MTAAMLTQADNAEAACVSDMNSAFARMEAAAIRKTSAHPSASWSVQMTSVRQGLKRLVGTIGFLSAVVLLNALVCADPAAAQEPNTAYGTGALSSNTTGTSNSAFGYFALSSNTTGNKNTAIGDAAL